MNLDKEQSVPTLSGFIAETATFLWKEWPKDMQTVFLDQNRFNLRGICPHPGCRRSSVFTNMAQPPCQESAGLNVYGRPVGRFVEILQCQGCRKYVLGIAKLDLQNPKEFELEEYYPLGKPDDTVAEEIPEPIAADFREALRCLWVDAYNATAEMCRRAIEASCVHLGAPPSKRALDDKIDWLESQRKITPFLQQVAHKIRLGGNRAAHPGNVQPSTGTASLTETAAPTEPPIAKEHAEAIVTFTREFFHHIYVVAKQLDKYDFSKPKAPAPAAPNTPMSGGF